MKQWFVIHTKPRQELKVAQRLSALNIESYCPTFRIVKQYSDRKKRVKKPLLPSYVMVHLHNLERVKVFSIPGVVNYLFWLGKPAIVKENEIALMQSYLSRDYKNITTKPIKRGEIYTIQDGHFSGEKGKVIEVKTSSFKLELPSLGVLLTLDRELA
tara:strand:- start:1066 stop:1536 length:471 start_codon:yes stop_codon:yes gene_type:complete